METKRAGDDPTTLVLPHEPQRLLPACDEERSRMCERIFEQVQLTSAIVQKTNGLIDHVLSSLANFVSGEMNFVALENSSPGPKPSPCKEARDVLVGRSLCHERKTARIRH